MVYEYSIVANSSLRKLYFLPVISWDHCQTSDYLDDSVPGPLIYELIFMQIPHLPDYSNFKINFEERDIVMVFYIFKCGFFCYFKSSEFPYYLKNEPIYFHQKWSETLTITAVNL